MMHPDTTVGYINEVLGLGIIATKPIPKGTIIYVYDSLEIVIPPDDPRISDPLYSRILEHFSFTDKRGNYVVLGPWPLYEPLLLPQHHGDGQ